MTTHFIANPEYVVYESQYTTYDPFKGLKIIGHPARHYDDYDSMVKRIHGRYS
jgi:hypothetical protein